MNKGIGADLKTFVGEMYIKHGHNEITVKLSQLLDIVVTEEQRERLRSVKTNNKR